MVNRPYPKFSFKFFGPYTVVEKIGTAAYRLDLPSGSLVHPAFHILQLKPFTPDYTPVYSDLSKLVDLDSLTLEPKAILDRCLVKKGNNVVPQVLIKWSHVPASSATWEDWYVITKRFPSVVAWGQSTSQAGEM